MTQIAQAVGIDVSKDSLDIHILASIGQTITSFKIDNTTIDIVKLEQLLVKNQVSKTVPIVVESTGDYHILMVLMLAEQGWNIRLINPIISGSQMQATIRKVKTDKVDALRLAELGIRQGMQLPQYAGNRQQVMIGKKLNLIHTLEKKRQAMKKSLYSVRAVSQQLCLTESDGIKEVGFVIKALDKAINKLKREIVEYYKNDPDLKRLSKIPGVSIENGSLILGQIQNRQFNSKAELVAFCGLDISVKESGKYRGQAKLTKRGNAHLRHVLFQTAWGLMMHQSQFKQLYEYHKQQGKHYYACINILARKFLHICYGILKSQSEFNPAKLVIPA